jgi:hypothetical protein
MRPIFHEILARFLDNEQHAFDPSWREFWPDVRPSWHPPVTSQAGGQLPARARRQRVQRELDHRN